jgi:phytoene desaturase
MSLFVWYFGTNRASTRRAAPHHRAGPALPGLLDDIFDRKHLAEDFSLYLHRPTATDPSLAPPGCDTFYALSAGAAPGQRHRLGAAGRALPRRHPAPARGHLLPGLGERSSPRA